MKRREGKRIGWAGEIAFPYQTNKRNESRTLQSKLSLYIYLEIKIDGERLHAYILKIELS